MLVAVLIAIFQLAMPPVTSYKIPQDPLDIVSREEWGAKPPTFVEPMANPVPFVVIHHSYIPAACYTKADCIQAMQRMQEYHQLNQSWNDIGYSFAAGSDNRIYMGRGWSAVGAHAPLYNNRSIGICVIGDWTEQLPPKRQMNVVKELISMGVAEGYIQEDYKLIGHRQVRDTTCPGDAFFAEIQTWPHWVSDPDIDDIPDPRENVDEHNKLKRENRY